MTASAPASQFVYVTFIRSTPEKVWDALTNPETMKLYWFGMPQACDWKVGSPWKMLFSDGRPADSGEVLEADKPRRIALKWRNDWKDELHAEGFSTCTYDIEEVDGAVKLTVTHTMDRPQSQFIQAVSGGWPKILSNLKSLLETGEPMFPPGK